jgi:hypothetical protein
MHKIFGYQELWTLTAAKGSNVEFMCKCHAIV